MATEKNHIFLFKDKYFNQIIYLDTVSSTQEYLKKMAKNGDRGIVCVARHQTNGHGRSGRTWFSDEKNLKFSMLFDLDISPHFLPIISLAAGIALKETIEKICSITAELKWPNDILINRKKVCGIISESASMDTHVKWVICGVGINLNMKKENIPEDLQSIATSLLVETNKQIEEKKFLETFLVCFSNYLAQLERNNNAARLIKKYQSMCDTIGKKIKIILENEIKIGIASRINEQGALVVKTDIGEEVFCSADIIHVRTEENQSSN